MHQFYSRAILKRYLYYKHLNQLKKGRLIRCGYPNCEAALENDLYILRHAYDVHKTLILL